jgi:PEP-CTERM/exosortase A-associated glycosyltransferase
MAGNRCLIVNADDFGRSHGVNRGIIRACEQGIVTSASLMVRWPAAEEAAAYARNHPEMSVGLHVDVWEWTYRSDAWVKSYEVVPIDDAAAIAREVSSQLEAFRRLVGADPTHLDSHHGAHRRSPTDSILTEVAQRLGVPLRDESVDVHSCGAFYGQSSTGYPLPRAITLDGLTEVLSSLPPGFTELRCHPGEPGDWDVLYRTERVLETAVLCDSRIRAALDAHGVELRSFRDVRPLSEFDANLVVPAFQKRGIDAYYRRAYREADQWFRKLTTCRASESEPWLWRARTQLRLGRTEESAKLVERALELAPDWRAALMFRIEVLAAQERGADAADLLERLGNIGELPAHLAYPVLDLLLRLEMFQAALDATEVLLSCAPDDGDALLARAAALWRSGEWQAAVTLVSSVRVRAVDDGSSADAAARECPALMQFAEDLRNEGFLKSAAVVFEHLLALNPRDAVLQQLHNVSVGEIQVLAGEWDRSRSTDCQLVRPVPGRVLHVVGRSLPYLQSGYTVRTHQVALWQRSAGIEPHVVTQLGFPVDQGVGDAPRMEEMDGIRYHRLLPEGELPIRPDKLLSANLSELTDLVRQLRPAVLHAASDFRNGMLAVSVGRKLGLPVVYEVRGFWEESWLSGQPPRAMSSEGYRWKCQRELECALQADRVVTLSETMKAELVQRGVPGEKVDVVPNVVDADIFVPIERDLALVSKLGIHRESAVLGYISTFWKYEGIRTLIDAVARLRARGHNVCALLVGDGEDRKNLEAHAAAVGVRDHVCFAGRVPHTEVARYYSVIDFFVVPRIAATVCQLVTPLKPLEAMATGRVLVVSGVRALRELVDDGVTGLVFRPEDPAHLADIVEPLLHDSGRRDAMGRAAREWVCQNRAWSGNGQRYVDLYRSMGVPFPIVAREEAVS